MNKYNLHDGTCHISVTVAIIHFFKEIMNNSNLPVRYVCSCNSVMLNSSAFCCWQLFLAWCHFRAVSEFIWYWTFVKGSVFHKSLLVTIGRNENALTHQEDIARYNIPKNCIAKDTKCLNTAIEKWFERNPEVL